MLVVDFFLVGVNDLSSLQCFNITSSTTDKAFGQQNPSDIFLNDT